MTADVLNWLYSDISQGFQVNPVTRSHMEYETLHP